MNRKSQLRVVLVFSCFLVFVGAQAVLPLFQGPLNGAVAAAPAPVWNWTTIRNGTAFRSFEAWYNERVGLRSFWVRLDNEVTYLFFGEATRRNSGTEVVVGSHDWLFERQYIQHAVTPTTLDREKMNDAIRHVRSVQDKLARRGIPFLLIIAPSKVEVYPEHVPEVYFEGRKPENILTDYEQYRPALLAAGINLYDGPQVFKTWKKAGQRNLFARGGTHWSYQAAFQVLKDVRERLNPQMARHQMPPFFEKERTVGPAKRMDGDLIHLLNLIDDFPFNHDQPYPELAAQKEIPVEQLPRILWVHDSFGWPLIELLYNANAAQPDESIYYFRNLYHIPGGTRLDTKLSEIDWEPYLEKHDAVVMVWTEIATQYLGWGFFEAVDEKLK